jgi:hypothetical protein
MRALTVIFLAAVLFVVNSCSRRAFDAATEEAKLLRQDSEWAEAASSGKDIEKVLSYWTDDALLIFPRQPILEGKAAITHVRHPEASLPSRLATTLWEFLNA